MSAEIDVNQERETIMGLFSRKSKEEEGWKVVEKDKDGVTVKRDRKVCDGLEETTYKRIPRKSKK